MVKKRNVSLSVPSLLTFFFVYVERLPAGSNGAGALGTSSSSQALSKVSR